MTLQNYEENPYDFMYGMFSKNTYVNNIFLDTFASKTAAIQDETADASVGNVTGSNAVNVFLGIGIAWSMAAIYWEAQGEIIHILICSVFSRLLKFRFKNETRR